MTAPTAALTRIGIAQQFRTLMPNVFTNASRIAGGRIEYVKHASERAPRERLVRRDWRRSDVDSQFDRAFAKAEEGTRDSMPPLSRTSTFVNTVRDMEALLDEPLERVLLGVTGRPHSSFTDITDMKNFYKFLDFNAGKSVREAVEDTGNDRHLIARDAMIAAERAEEKGHLTAAARAYFTLGMIYALMGDKPEMLLSAENAFDKGGAVYLKDGRSSAAAISLGLAAEARSLSDPDDVGLQQLYTDEGRAWLAAAGDKAAWREDRDSALMRIFNGLYASQLGGDLATSRQLWELLADFLTSKDEPDEFGESDEFGEFDGFGEVADYASAVDNMSRVVLSDLENAPVAENHDYWMGVVGDMLAIIGGLDAMRGNEGTIVGISGIVDRIVNNLG